MKRFVRWFSDRGLVPADFVSLAGKIYALRNAEQGAKKRFMKVFTKMRAVANVQSVKDSNANEGFVTISQRIAEIVNPSSPPLY